MRPSPEDHSPAPSTAPTLFDRVSRSIGWNALLLPLITVLNALTSILVRRSFGLHSAAYDILLGLSNTLLFYTSLGIPTSLSKFLPEQEAAGGRSAVLGFLRQAGALRLALLAAALVPVNLFAEPLAERLLLGAHGAFLIHVLSALAIGRALYELVIEGLHSNLGQLAVNLLTLLQSICEPALIGLALVLGYGIGGVIGALALAAALLTAAGMVPLARALAAIPRHGGPRPAGAVERPAVLALRGLHLRLRAVALLRRPRLLAHGARRRARQCRRGGAVRGRLLRGADGRGDDGVRLSRRLPPDVRPAARRRRRASSFGARSRW